MEEVLLNAKQDDSELEIKLDGIGIQKDATTSLCDRFGVYIYSPDFLAKEVAYKKKQNEQNDLILEAVFENKGQAGTEEMFLQVMNANAGTVLKTEYEAENDETAGQFSMYAYGLTGILIAGALLFMIEKWRRKKANETDRDN